MKKLTWISTPTLLQLVASRRAAALVAPEGALLYNDCDGKPAGMPFASVRDGKVRRAIVVGGSVGVVL